MSKQVTVRLGLFVLVVLSILHLPSRVDAAKAEHVLIIVCDGLRPDLVTEENMPTLWKLSRQGVFFENHHSVFPATTEVNGTALGTGCYPQRSGILANSEFRPETYPLGSLGTESDYAVWKGDQLRNGHYLERPTFIEIARQAGRTTAVAGTKPVALLLDRLPREPKYAELGPIVYAGDTRPSSVFDDLRAALGPIPPVASSSRRANSAQDEWTTRAMVEKFWAKQVPAVSVLWFSEPDFAQHGSGIASRVGKAALKSSDDNIARALAALEQRKLREKTDIMVVSDHGFSSIARGADTSGTLTRAGLRGSAELGTGDVTVVGSLIYVKGHDEALIRRAVEALQASDFMGVIFTKKAMPGTFAMEQAGVETKDAPDIIVSMFWTDDANANGAKGSVSAGGTRGLGTHGNLSRYDLNNTLIAAGPDFRTGLVSKLPSGNIDVAPTVLWLLGVKADGMDGRVLGEAIIDGPAPKGEPQTTVLEASNKVGETLWQQYLKITKFGGAMYLDEGNWKDPAAK